MRPWLLPDNPPAHPDCFIVPSYALKNSTTPTLPTQAEIQLAADWWKRHQKAVIIFSTGDNQGLGVTNAAVMANYARRIGIPEECIIEEDQSRNTLENLRNCQEIVKTAGHEEPTLVTLDLYTRRAVAIARKLGWPRFYWLSAYSKGDPASGYKYFQTHSRISIRLYEMAAMVYGRLVGWL